MIEKNKTFFEVVVLLLVEMTALCRIVSVLDHCHFTGRYKDLKTFSRNL